MVDGLVAELAPDIDGAGAQKATRIGHGRDGPAGPAGAVEVLNAACVAAHPDIARARGPDPTEVDASADVDP